MIRLYALVLLTLVLSSCASKPPVQAMAEARAAVDSIRIHYSNTQNQDNVAYRFYKSAEKSLMDATTALDEKRYDVATQKAQEAKRQARMAVKLK